MRAVRRSRHSLVLAAAGGYALRIAKPRNGRPKVSSGDGPSEMPKHDPFVVRDEHEWDRIDRIPLVKITLFQVFDFDGRDGPRVKGSNLRCDLRASIATRRGKECDEPRRIRAREV